MIARALGVDLSLASARWPALRAFGACLDAGRGVWALRLDALRELHLDGGVELEGSWSLVYASPEGRTVALRPWSEAAVGPEVNFVCSEECTLIQPPVSFDHDGDGVAEVSVVVERTRPLGDHPPGDPRVASGHGRLWTFREGRIEVYDLARDLVVSAHRDGDGDGRPDLYSYGPYTAEAPGACGRRAWPIHGPSFMAHALPDGSFSFRDGTARASLSRVCSAVSEAGGYLEYVELSARTVVCARLSGRDPESALREMRAVPRPAGSPLRCRRGSPDDRDVLLDWARMPPWITFP